MAQTYLLGIDAGTSLIKSTLYDDSGTKIATTSAKVPVHSPHAGWSEQDMDETWHGVVTTIKDLLEQTAINPADIAVVCPAGQGDGAWMIDADGGPVRPAPLWNDGRAADIVAAWEASGVIEAAFEPGGTAIWTGTAAGVLAWLKQHEPENYRRVDKVLFCKDWIKYNLTGVICTDQTDGSIPFLDVATQQYDPEQLARLGLSEILPKLADIVPAHDIAGHVTEAVATLTGLAAGTPVISGMMDVNANAIGVGAIKAGQSFTILGTTGINCSVLDQPVFEPPNIGASACHTVPGHWIRLLGSMAGTPNLDWYLRNMGHDPETLDFGEIERQVTDIPAGCGGVIFHPYLQGERAPFLNASATGSFFGATATTTSAHMIRAVYEGVAFSVKHCYSLMGVPDEVFLAGGGAQSPLWSQMIADMLNCTVTIPAGAQFGTLGAAMTGGVGVGIFDSFDDAVQTCVRVERRYDPDPQTVAIYDALFPLYTDLITRMDGFWRQRRAFLHSLATEQVTR
ncbi:MAG: FGGY-family carbohydrate kinase [Chloroflexota bacterium]